MDSSTSDFKSSLTLTKKNKHSKKYSSKKDKYSKSKSKRSSDREKRSSRERRNESLHKSSDSQRLRLNDYKDKKYKTDERNKRKDKISREKEKIDHSYREKKSVNYKDRASQSSYSDKDWIHKKDSSSRESKNYRKETKSPEDHVKRLKNQSPVENGIEENDVKSPHKDSQKDITLKQTTSSPQKENISETNVKPKKRLKMYSRNESSIDHYSYLIQSESSSEESSTEMDIKSYMDISDEKKSVISEDDKSDEEMDSDTKVVIEEDKEKAVEISTDVSSPSKEEINKTDLPTYFPAIQGCRFVEEYHRLNRINEGTYGIVYRGRDKQTNEIVALKRLKMEKEREGFPITSLREINTLLKAQHPNIVTVKEIVVGCNMDKIYIVMDFVEHDLKSLMESKKDPFLIGEVKTLMIQLLRGVQHLHDNWIIHRDIKTSNLLLSHKGILKVGDFGLAREYGSPLKPYTPVVVTLWYRAPELLLGIKEYSTAIDLWSVGCVFAELLTMKPLFPGKSEIDQINRIFKDLGTPSEKIWPGYSDLPLVKKCKFSITFPNVLRKKIGTQLTDLGFDLMGKFLTYNPATRVTAENALKHEYFIEDPYPIKPSKFPIWPAKSEQMPRNTSPKPPSGGKQFAKLLENDDDDILSKGFHLASTAKGPAFSLKF